MARRQLYFLVARLLLVALCLNSSSSTAFAEGPNWFFRYPAPAAGDLHDVVYAQGLFVAVGDHGVILTSADGVTWTQQASETDVRLNTVTYGEGVFLVGGGKGVLRKSADGSTWERAADLGDYNILSIAYGNGRFVAMAASSQERVVLVSDNGVDWDHVSGKIFTQNFPWYVSFGGGFFYAAGMAGVHRSADGITWETSYVPHLNNLYWTNCTGGRIFVGGPNPGQKLITSVDGVTWESVTSLPSMVTDVVAADGRLVAIGTSAYTSVDGTTWTQHATPTWVSGQRLKHLAFGNGVLVAVGDRGTIGRSPDGATWTLSALGSEGFLYDLAYGGNAYVAVGHPGLVLTSPDAVKWSRQEATVSGSLRSVSYGAGRFLVTTDSSALLTSTDGLKWEPTPAPAQFYVVRYLNDHFMGTSWGSVYLSTDGLTWSGGSQVGKGVVRDIVYSHGLYVAVGDGPQLSDGSNRSPAFISTSPNGRSWTTRSPDIVGGLQAVASGNGILVATGGQVVVMSHDGVTWTAVMPAVSDHFQSVTFDGSRFLLFGLNHAEESVDGVTWQALAEPDLSFRKASYLGGQVVTIVSATSIVTMPPVRQFTCSGMFGDLRSGADCPAAERLANRGVVSGFPDGTFRPNDKVTRAQFAKMLAASLNWDPAPLTDLPFSDTSGHWAAEQGYLQAVWLKKAIGGFPDGSFRPDASITRAQLVKVLAAATDLKPSTSTPYNDLRPDQWFSSSVMTVHEGALIGPMATFPLWSGDLFQADRAVTRGEAALILANLLETLR